MLSRKQKRQIRQTESAVCTSGGAGTSGADASGCHRPARSSLGLPLDGEYWTDLFCKPTSWETCQIVEDQTSTTDGLCSGFRAAGAGKTASSVLWQVSKAPASNLGAGGLVDLAVDRTKPHPEPSYEVSIASSSQLRIQTFSDDLGEFPCELTIGRVVLKLVNPLPPPDSPRPDSSVPLRDPRARPPLSRQLVRRQLSLRRRLLGQL